MRIFNGLYTMRKLIFLISVFTTPVIHADVGMFSGIASRLTSTPQRNFSSTPSLEDRMRAKYDTPDCIPNSRYCSKSNKPVSHPPAMPQYSQEDLALMSKGIWRDAATNLFWYRCPSDQKWNGKCDEKYNQFKWKDSIFRVQQLNKENFLGYSDWRMASKAELISLQSALRNQQTSDLGELNVMHTISDDYYNLLENNYVYYARAYVPVDIQYDGRLHQLSGCSSIIFTGDAQTLLKQPQYTPGSDCLGDVRRDFRIVRGGVDNGEYANAFKAIGGNDADTKHLKDLEEKADKCAEDAEKHWVPKKGELTDKGMVADVRGDLLQLYKEGYEGGGGRLETSFTWLPKSQVKPLSLGCYREVVKY